MSKNKSVIIAVALIGVAILLSAIVVPFGVFGSEEDSSGGNGDDSDNSNENGDNDNSDREEPTEPEPEPKPEPEVPEEPPIEEPVPPSEPEPCSSNQDGCESPTDPCVENPDLEECKPPIDPCVENPDLDECNPSYCIPEDPDCIPILPPPQKCPPGFHFHRGLCIENPDDDDNNGGSSSKTTIILPSATTVEVSNCRLDGNAHGMQQKFDSIKYQACGLYLNGQIAYTDGFVMGCTQVGNTPQLCQAFVVMNTQRTQTGATQPSQAIQPSGVS